MGWIAPQEVARRRIIEEFVLDKGKGKIVANGRTFEIHECDDVVDLAQLCELIMLRLTGKVLNDKLRPRLTDPSALRPCKMVGGDYSLASGPLPATTTCDVTGECVRTHYLKVEIQGNTWEQWFGRLDELVKCLYVIVREAQGDKYEPGASILIGRGAIMTGDVGHA